MLNICMEGKGIYKPYQNWMGKYLE